MPPSSKPGSAAGSTPPTSSTRRSSSSRTSASSTPTSSATPGRRSPREKLAVIRPRRDGRARRAGVGGARAGGGRRGVVVDGSEQSRARARGGGVLPRQAGRSRTGGGRVGARAGWSGSGAIAARDLGRRAQPRRGGIRPRAPSVPPLRRRRVDPRRQGRRRDARCALGARRHVRRDASSNERALPAGELAARAGRFFERVETVADPAEAVEQARELAGDEAARSSSRAPSICSRIWPPSDRRLPYHEHALESGSASSCSPHSSSWRSWRSRLAQGGS